jgi:putative flavoprotein involved in K+ transport
VLEQAAHPANVWRDARWDSFTLVTPNWTLRMPGAAYDGAEPDAYLSRDEVVAYFDRYVDRFRLPVRCNTRVVAVEPIDGAGYRVRTTETTMRADNVVIATGYEQHPKIPPFAADLPSGIAQLHSSRYRNPASLPVGAVLVVGTAQSGCQIAEELYQSGRRVFLATGGGAGRAPRRYRGQDAFSWLDRIGFFDRTPDQLPFPKERFAAPHVSGTKGGHTLNLHRFARDGVTLLGHVRGVAGDTIAVAPDLHDNLGRIDRFEREVATMIDGYIQTHGLDAPIEELPRLDDGYAQPVIEELDLTAAGITAVVWATGYRYDYGLVKAPVFDAGGFPIQTRGITGQAGLSFVGMPWMPSLKSGILVGVGDCAAHIASTIAASAERGRRLDAPGDVLPPVP